MSQITATPDTARRVVVGFDGSARARRAVHHAARYADGRSLGLTVLLASPLLDPTTPRVARAVKADPGYLEAIRTAAADELRGVCEEVTSDHPDLSVIPALMAGNPAGALATASLDAALVVIGARGNTEEHRAPMLGGVSTAVIAHAHGPVLVVPENAIPTPDGPVVVGLQDAPDSLAAGKLAVAEAEQRGVPLVALYAWDIAPELGDLGALARLDPVKTQRDLDQMLTELLEPLIADHPDLPVQRRVVQGSARTALVDASALASLVVIGSRGLGGFAGLLLGSISRSVTREAVCPVMIVRHRGPKTDAA